MNLDTFLYGFNEDEQKLIFNSLNLNKQSNQILKQFNDDMKNKRLTRKKKACELFGIRYNCSENNDDYYDLNETQWACYTDDAVFEYLKNNNLIIEVDKKIYRLNEDLRYVFGISNEKMNEINIKGLNTSQIINYAFEVSCLYDYF